MNDQIVALKKKVDWLERKVGDLEKNHATVAKYFQALEPIVSKPSWPWSVTGQNRNQRNCTKSESCWA